MPERASARPTKTRSKLFEKDAVENPAVDSDFARSTSFSKAPTSLQTAHKQPVRKKQAQGKQGRLAGLINMPIDVFVEIASHLLPIDIIHLARSNKFFRKLLMDRSSIHIWRGAMRNEPDLPECPPDLSEPRYLVLVFSQTCTYCGKAAKLNVDVVIRVRLCNPCRKECLITFDNVPQDVVPLIPFSGAIAASRRRVGACILREDLTSLVAEYEEHKLNGEETLRAWVVKKQKVLEERLHHARALKTFLDIREDAREIAKHETRAERQREIARRLEEMGWTLDDLDFCYPGCYNRREWIQLVSQARPLTNRVWTSIQPKLIALLEANRERRLEVGRRNRKYDRQVRLSKLFREIKKRDTFTVQIPAHSPATLPPNLDSPIDVSYQPPFPDFHQTLDCPTVLDLFETDRTVAEMDAQFEEHREEIEGYIAAWTDRIQAHLIQQVQQGPQPSEPILESNLTTGNNLPDPFADISDDIKPLLRADSFFATPAEFSFGRPLMYGSLLRVECLTSAHTCVMTAAFSQPPPLLDHIRWDSQANRVARKLLTDLARPNASYLEMTDKLFYECSRCYDTQARSWEDMVYHYIWEEQLYERVQKGLRSSKMRITFNNVHDLEQNTKQRLVQYSLQSMEDGPSELRFKCEICAYYPIWDKVVTSQAKIFKHLFDVHGVTKPVVNEHYVPRTTESESDCSDSDEWFQTCSFLLDSSDDD